MKKLLWTLVIVVAVFVIALVGGSFYMLDYSLAPDPNRMDTDSCYQQQFEAYPESKEWVDSLRDIDALRDTFLTMPTGERHHAFYVNRGSSRTAIVVHGWRDCAIKFFWLARIYEHELGYNVVMPELHGCGESEGEAIQMGWKDRLDVMQWVKTFQADTMVVHGVSMGAATTMMLSGEQMPEGIKDLRFVEDCGYTCVWDEFAGQLKEQFWLPEFPLMHSTSLLCRLRYGWSFDDPIDKDRVVESKKFIEIVEARVEEIVENVWFQVPAEYADKLLGGIILTGGGSNMPEIGRAFKMHTHIDKIRIAKFINQTVNSKDPRYTNHDGTMNTVLGLLAKGNMNCAGDEINTDLFNQDGHTTVNDVHKTPRNPNDTVGTGVVLTAAEKQKAEEEARKKIEEEEEAARKAAEEEAERIKKEKKEKSIFHRGFRFLKKFVEDSISEEE